MEKVFDLVILGGAVQGILFSTYLWFRPLNNKKANLFLSLFILGFSLNAIYYALETLGIRGNLNVWDFAPLSCPFLFIASLYLFIHFLVFPSQKWSWKHGIIFLPFLLHLLYQFWGIFWSLKDQEQIYRHIDNVLIINDVIDIISILMGVLVVSLSLRKLKLHDKKIMQHYAELTGVSLRWLYFLLLGLCIILILFTIPTLVSLATANSPFSMYYPTWIATSALIYWIGYSTYARKIETDSIMGLEYKPIKKVSLSDKTAKYHQSLIRLMEDDKVYLDQELNLASLAEKLGISSSYLSQIINQYEAKNFFDFVNSYRVEAFKSKIFDPACSHLNLLGMAFESGFKSKSTFNLAFKKLTGMTPTAFKKSQKKS